MARPPTYAMLRERERKPVAALDGGMTSGRPSVMLRFGLPDGRTVLAETSMRLFLTAARAFAARYGWQNDEP